jgi:hypothetical protein
VTAQRRPAAALTITSDELVRRLRRQFKFGLHAERLLSQPALIAFLCPDHPHDDLFDLAWRAEARLRAVIEYMGSRDQIRAKALMIITGLAYDVDEVPSLVDRREQVGRLLAAGAKRVKAATVLKNYEEDLARSLAFRLWQRARLRETGPDGSRASSGNEHPQRP